MAIPKIVYNSFKKFKSDRTLNKIFITELSGEKVFIFNLSRNGEFETLVIFNDGTGNWVDGVIADRLVALSERIK